MTAEDLAQVFADEHREILSWRLRRPHPGEPHCWFVNGLLDEYGISTRELGRTFLRNRVFHEPQRFGTDFSDERVYELLDLAKNKLSAS